MKDTEKNIVILNNVIINKLESIAFDIKYYININSSIAQSLDEESMNAYKFMDDEDINELFEIKERINRLKYKLKNKISEK